MKKHTLILAVIACLLGASGCAGRSGGTTLTLAHVNDTHGHLDPAVLSFTVDNETIRTEAAGFPRLAARLNQLRAEHKNLLFLHAGDVFSGTLYFSLFGGRADCNLLNALGLDVLVPGNHEFDRGPQALADFAEQANFAIVAANIDAAQEPLLSGRIKPYVIKDIGAARVGIVGLAKPETPRISRPGPNLSFGEPLQAARKAIQALASQGVHNIIVVSHLGYKTDMELAARLPEVDVIVGGHTHSLLGDYTCLGLQSAGPYPTVCKNADNATALVVQAWEWARVVGSLTVAFDAAGRLSSWQAEPVMPVGTSFVRQDKTPVAGPELAKVNAVLSRCPTIASMNEDAATRSLIEPYARQASILMRQKITRAPADIVHVRLPGPQQPAGSELAPLVADSMLWKVRAADMAADAVITNAGAVRGSIAAGDVTTGQIAELLPFNDTLVVCSLTGSQVRRLLESGIDRALTASESGAFPYVAGLRFTADVSRPAGRRLLKIDIADGRGRWRSLAARARYRIVVNSYLARGADGYELLAQEAKQVSDTGFFDAATFVEYARLKPELVRAPEKRITVAGTGK